jgi:hypothetical protein
MRIVEPERSAYLETRGRHSQSANGERDRSGGGRDLTEVGQVRETLEAMITCSARDNDGKLRLTFTDVTRTAKINRTAMASSPSPKTWAATATSGFMSRTIKTRVSYVSNTSMTSLRA